MPFLLVVSGVHCYTDVRHTVCQYWTAVKPGRPAGENLITGHMCRLVTLNTVGQCVCLKEISSHVVTDWRCNYFIADILDSTLSSPSSRPVCGHC